MPQLTLRYVVAVLMGVALTATVAAQNPTQTPVTPTQLPSAPPAALSPGSSDVAALLDRLDTIVNEALGKMTSTNSVLKGGAPDQAMGTTGTMAVNGTTANKVTVDRSLLDEMRAEIQQLKVLLRTTR